MEIYFSSVKVSPALTCALTEIRLIQRARVKAKITEKVTIGDAEATAFYGNSFKTYNGTVTIVRIEDKFQVELLSDGKTLLVVICEQIISCSMQEATVTLQIEEGCIVEKYIFKFHSEEQANVFTLKLPAINRPLDYNSTDSSDTQFDDSGNEKTEGFKDNSFDEDNPSPDLEEL